MKRLCWVAALLVGCSSAQVKPQLAACQTELRTASTERDVMALQAQKIIEQAQAQDAEHQHDKAQALQYFRQLQLYCPKRGA